MFCSKINITDRRSLQILPMYGVYHYNFHTSEIMYKVIKNANNIMKLKKVPSFIEWIRHHTQEKHIVNTIKKNNNINYYDFKFIHIKGNYCYNVFMWYYAITLFLYSLNLFLEYSTCASDNSEPMQVISFDGLNFSHAIPVVPVPIKGSYIILFGFA